MTISRGIYLCLELLTWIPHHSTYLSYRICEVFWSGLCVCVCVSVVQDTISRCMWANKHSEERHSPCPQRVTQSGGEEECVCKRCFRRTDLQELWPHRGTVLCLFLRFSLESLKVTCTPPFLQSTQKDLLKNKQTNKKWTTGFSLGSHSCK